MMRKSNNKNSIEEVMYIDNPYFFNPQWDKTRYELIIHESI